MVVIESLVLAPCMGLELAGEAIYCQHKPQRSRGLYTPRGCYWHLLVCVMGSVIRTGCYFNKESLNYQVPQIRQNHWVRTLWGWPFSFLGMPKLEKKLERDFFCDRIIWIMNLVHWLAPGCDGHRLCPLCPDCWRERQIPAPKDGCTRRSFSRATWSKEIPLWQGIDMGSRAKCSLVRA